MFRRPEIPVFSLIQDNTVSLRFPYFGIGTRNAARGPSERNRKKERKKETPDLTRRVNSDYTAHDSITGIPIFTVLFKNSRVAL